MIDRRFWNATAVASVLAAMLLATPAVAHSQQASLEEASLKVVRSALANPSGNNVIIVGFVGGFVSRNDTRHPEVQFAAYLRDRYPSVYSDVFGNHHGRKALHQVELQLDTDHDGIITTAEKQRATIIIYGHSWGATETVAFARKLGEMGIPVALTIQIDTIGKPLHKASAISPNVAQAINFYQTGGPLHGQPEIVPVDPERTRILGNIHMTYEDRPINCDNYSWYSRTINKPHHEIENDFRVWDRVAFLIDSDLPAATSIPQAPAPSRSPYFQYLKRGIQADEAETALLETSPAS